MKPITENDKNAFIQLLHYAADCMRYYERVATLPDCNNCRRAETGCIYLPKWGEDVRINCPHWTSEEDADA